MFLWNIDLSFNILFWLPVCLFVCVTDNVTITVDDKQIKKQISWPESVSKLYWPSKLSLVGEVSVNFCVVRMADPQGRNLGFIDRSHYFFFQVAPQLYSRGRVDLVPHPQLLTKWRRESIPDPWICDHRPQRRSWIANYLYYNPKWYSYVIWKYFDLSVVFPVVSFLHVYLPNFVSISLLCHICYMSHPSHSPWHYHFNIWQRVQIKQLIII
jgi:hypothetical protein